MLNLKQKNPPKHSWVWSKNSKRETENFSYIPIIFLNLISNIKSTVYFFTITLKNISQCF